MIATLVEQYDALKEHMRDFMRQTENGIHAVTKTSREEWETTKQQIAEKQHELSDRIEEIRKDEDELPGQASREIQRTMDDLKVLLQRAQQRFRGEIR